MRKLLAWASYSLQPKRTALYRLDPAARRFDLVLDLPSAGDTAFPSVVRLSPNEFLVANYSSAFRHEKRTWIWGQFNGTGIYFVRLRFEPVAPPGHSAHSASIAAGHPPVLVPAPDFHEDWPMRESHTGKLAGVGTMASLGACAIVRLRRRRIAAAGRLATSPITP
jgi:hypothetical protein